MLRKEDILLKDAVTNLLVDMLDPQLKHVLHDIVGIRIYDEVKCVSRNSSSQLVQLPRCGLIDTLLHDTAAVLVACNLDALSVHGLVDELFVVLVPGLEYFLENVITVDVIAHVYEALLKVLAHQFELDWLVDRLYQFLN